MEFNFNVGDKLMLALSSGETIEGSYINGSHNRIELTEVTSYDTGTKINGIFSYYRNEIESIKLLNNDEPHSDSICDEATADSDCILLKHSEFERLKKMLHSYTYIATMDIRYFDATSYLSSCENVSVVSLSSGSGRLAQIDLLVLASWDHIYIFDIAMFDKKQLPKELCEILESELIKKVVHDARLLADCLHYCYKIKLGKVFDTKIADLVIQKRENRLLDGEVRTLSECLKKYLNFPVTILKNAEQTPLQKWAERPLKDKYKNHAALLVLYLITLMSTMEEHLLKDVYEATRIELNSIINSTAVEAQRILHSTKISLETETVISRMADISIN